METNHIRTKRVQGVSHQAVTVKPVDIKWDKMLAEAWGDKAEPVPEGFKNDMEWANHFGKERSYTYTVINKLVAKGLWEKKKFYTGGYPKFYYRPIP